MAQAATPKRVKKKIRKKVSGAGFEQGVHKHDEVMGRQALTEPERLSEVVQNKKCKSGKKKLKQGDMNQKKEINSALSVLDAMLDPSEKIHARSGSKPKTVSLDDPEDLDSDKKRTLSKVSGVSVEDVENGRKLKKGKKRRQPTDISSAKAPMSEALIRSVGESNGNDFGMLTWYQGGDEESDDEAKPKEENAKAMSVMDKVLAQEDKFDDISDEELAEKKTGRGKGRKLFIANLPWKVDAETIQADFEKYGEIDSFSMPTNKQTGKPMGICFIVYSNTEGVEKALLQHESTYNGRKIRVTIADPDAKGKAKGKGQGDEGSDSKDDQKGKSNGKGKEDGLSSKGKSKGKGKGKDNGKGKEGDWNCPRCGDHQFGRNSVCRKCGGPKPAGADDGKGKDNGKGKGIDKGRAKGNDKGKGKGNDKGN